MAGKVSILIAEGTLDEAFYWSSIKRAKKLKKIVKQLNRKLPEMLREKRKPTFTQTLTVLKPQERLFGATATESLKVKVEPEKAVRLELWKPQTFQTKGSSQTLKWLVENLPEKSTSIREFVEQASEETGIEKAAFETAVWRLIQQGQLYQPEPGKIRKI